MRRRTTMHHTPVSQRKGPAVAIGTGIMAGVSELIFAIALATLVYRGQSADNIAHGIGLIVLGSIPMLLVSPLLASYKAYIALPQDAPIVLLALIAASMTQQMAGASDRARFVTLAATIAITTLLTGLTLLLVGQFKLGSLVRFLPYPVIGGFLAGTGWLLLLGGIEVMTDLPFGLANLAQYVQPGVIAQWVPGLLAGAAIFWTLRRSDNYLLFPIMLLGLAALFHVIAAMGGASVTTLSAQGWLMGPFSNAQLLGPLSFADARLIDWSFLGAQSVSLVTIVLISLASLLLNISGIELFLKRDIDVNRELRAYGLGNIISGMLGGSAGYPLISLTTFVHKIGGEQRLIPLTAAAVFVLPFLFGFAALSYIPKLMIGAMLIVFGLSFLFEWLYEAWWKFSKLEYAIVLLILVSIATLGFLPGVAVGFVAAVALFVISYSRVNVTRNTLTGAEIKSRIARSPAERAVLDAHGHKTLVLKLQGYLFFGTAHTLLENLRQRIDHEAAAELRYVVLDFEKVSGLDASAMLSLVKLKQVLDARAVSILIAGATARIQQRLQRDAFAGESAVFRNLDHAMESVERNLLTDVAQPHTLRDSMASAARDDAQLAALFTFLDRRQVAPGDYLIRQADPADDIYFVESGRVTAQLENPGNPPVRLESMGPGHVVGELGFYLGQQRTASVVVDEPGVVYQLTSASLTRMEQTEPTVASYFHRLIVRLLAARTTHLIRVVDALEK
jgi:sulfate permease, SulP family